MYKFVHKLFYQAKSDVKTQSKPVTVPDKSAQTSPAVPATSSASTVSVDSTTATKPQTSISNAVKGNTVQSVVYSYSRLKFAGMPSSP